MRQRNASPAPNTAANDNAFLHLVRKNSRGNVTTLGGQSFIYALQLVGEAKHLVRWSKYNRRRPRQWQDKKRVRSIVNGKTIYNVYDASGTLSHVFEPGTNPKTTDYVGGFLRITDGTLTYLHKDHLGSAVAGTSQWGGMKWWEQYTPFGEVILDWGDSDNLDGFTGHIRDKATGLNYMQARYYDPAIGRFLSIDPVGFSAGRPFMFGRYTYVGNDPVNGTDPTGMAGDTPFYVRWFNLGGEQAAANAYNTAVESTIPGSASDTPSGVSGEDSYNVLGNMVVATGEAFINNTISLFLATALDGITGPGLGAGSKSALSPMARGVANEARVLKEMGLAKNTQTVATAEGRSIPDALTEAISVEIKDAVCVTCTRQIRIQTDAAKASGRQSVLVTGTETKVNDNARKAFDQIILDDSLGPQ